MRSAKLGFICGLLLCIGSGQLVAQPQDAQEHEQLRQFLQQSIADSESFEDRFDAEVWLLDMSNRLQQYVKDPEQRLQLLQEVHRYASQSQLPPERFAVSRVGAQGMMQVMPFWKDEIGRPEDNLTLTSTNLSYGCRILQFYLKREKGNLPRALAAYNGSLGSTRYSDKVEAAWRRNWRGPNLDWR